MSLELPYGIWTCPDGREVLFNRWYQPIWQRRSGEAAQPIDPGTWIEKAAQRWFYGDANPPWSSRKTLSLLEDVLRQWGVPMPDPHASRPKPKAYRHQLYRERPDDRRDERARDDQMEQRNER